VSHPWTASPQGRYRHLYDPRKLGGWGVMQLEEAYGVEITILLDYVDRNEDPLI
jgi:hypothetical protein